MYWTFDIAAAGKIQAMRLNKHLGFQRDLFIHRKGTKNAKIQFIHKAHRGKI